MEFDYLEWAMSQKLDGLTYERSDAEHLLLHTDRYEGAVNIYHLENDVVELQLTSKEDGQNVFFLHFEMKNEEHAKELYNEMLETLQRSLNNSTVNILLSCTSGLTTTFFAEKLNEAASTLSLDYHFQAVPFAELYDYAFQNDVILLAPQIAYEYDRVKEIVRNAIVLKIPGHAFGTYDAGAVISMVRDELQNKKKTIEAAATAKVMRDIENNARIFALAMTHDTYKNRYVYRIYEEGNVVFNETVIKEKTNPQDLLDILDTQLLFQKFDAVSISVPGNIANQISIGFEIYKYDDFAQALEKRYGVPMFVTHNTNTVALGYYAQQDQYNVVTYHSQPRGSLTGGQGMVFNGEPIKGRSSIAGEITYINKNFLNVTSKNHRCWDPEKTLDVVAKDLLVNIAMFDPDVILVRSDLTPDMNLMRDELAKMIEPEYIPDLLYVPDPSDYALLGTMLMGLKGLKERKKANA